MKDRRSPLTRREELGRDYALLTFEHPEIAGAARAGQFAMLQALPGSDLILRRPFSIMDTDQANGTFTVFLKAVGAGSRSLFDLRLGGEARALGPLGQPFSHPRAGETAMLVAGGYGVAPFALFSRALREHSTPACVFYGGRSASDLPFVDELRKRGLTPTLSTDDGSSGVHGRVTLPLTESLDALLARGEKVRLYACGPHPMMHAVAEIARARTVPCEVSLDPWMGCGLGTCLGCVVRIQRAGETKPKMRPACVDGPVFDAAEVRW